MSQAPANSAGAIRHVIVTGGNGYIGRRLVDSALAAGWDVTVLARSQSATPQGARFARWQLGDACPAIDPSADRTALLHLAHDWTDRDEHGINFRGTERLFATARERGVARFIFASSQSARVDALNAYGRIKWTIEQAIAGDETASARIGLVYGGPRRGLYGLLTKLVSLSPVLPMIEPERTVQPIHVDEVCRGLLLLADNCTSGWVGLAAPKPLSFAEVLRTLAREAFGLRLVVLPVPLGLALAAARAMQRIPLAPRVDEERILGLAGTQVLDCAAHLRALGLPVAPLADGLRHDKIGRKALLREARALLRYILRAKPGDALVRRYARAVRRIEGNAGPLALLRLAHWTPGALRLVEPLHPSSPLAGRLTIALGLAEMSREGAAAIDRSAVRGRIGVLLATLSQIALDAACLPLRFWFGR